jgi:hypothetical protein
MSRMTLMVLLSALALGGCTAEQNAQREDLGLRLRNAGAALRDNPPQPMMATRTVRVCDVYQPTNCHIYQVQQ